MNQQTPKPIEIQFTPEFKRNLRVLAKKYRSIRLDIEPVIQALLAGNLPGDQIPQVGYIRSSRFVFLIEMLNVEKAGDTESFITSKPK